MNNTNTELMLDVGQANEFKLACRREGFNNEDIKSLCEQKGLLAQIRSVMHGVSEIKPIEHVVDCDANAVIPEGYNWTVEEHRKGGVVKLERKGSDLYVNGKKIEFYLSKKQNKGNSIVGNDLRKEMEKKSVLNANLADYLEKNPQLIPDEWKKDADGNTRYIFFWGTIYRDSGGGLYVRCLCWDGDRWVWCCNWLDRGWHFRLPAAVSAS